ncbi:MAG: ATP synthase subunit a [Candidatus Jorgensenbacteria bacterium GW2011_GWA1_48_13]|uniref:ATP synthase subunit a n=2 Tax=Candidatus Joergenseniibacteriota TaxID=1752739 RepID=A0A0G1W894_9BACT|nr:MAG: ATP synthase subunit a [Candidatus Jorgensenbacteria bacterium GW2011_GWA1_48_13]KKU99313.1 MAG: ATP synthase subunit a [Candidatus Jorgensenbacteria bacterium GW2011_GWC1_48_8]KKW14996.1 MAG: ATP synthase subunit a [Candidatus Jorgensenbacteria bacterium GW2011_GWB1_50_10]
MIEGVHISLSAEKILDVFGFPLTNTLLTSFLVVISLMVGAYVLGRKIKAIPAGIQNAAEFVIDGLLGFMTTIAGDRKTAEKFFPIVATIFIFVLFANWAGIIPGVGSIGFYEDGKTFVPFFRSVNSDLNMTLALALIAVTLSHFFGVAGLGAFKHAGKFFNFKNPIGFFVGILEFVSEFAKIISFSFRLFGNVFAGEVLLVIITFLVPVIAPVPFYGLEIFVGFIQALIFAVLTMMFLVVATKHH